MGQTVVDRTATPEDAAARAETVVALLVAEGIVGEERLVERPEGNPFTGPVTWVKDKRIWLPGPRALDAVAADIVAVRKEGIVVREKNNVRTVVDFRQQDPNHLELVIGWEYHGPDDAKPACPACRASWPWDLVLGALAALGRGDDGTMVCPSCRAPSDPRTADLEGGGVAGALGYVFASWWPFRADVIARMQEAVPGSRLQVVRHDD